MSASPAVSVWPMIDMSAAGLDAIEVSSNLMADYERASIVPYVAVERDVTLLLHDLDAQLPFGERAGADRIANFIRAEACAGSKLRHVGWREYN